MFNNNPMFYPFTMPTPKPEDIKRVISMQDNSFFERMQEVARQRGISEDAIKEGMAFIEAMRR